MFNPASLNVLNFYPLGNTSPSLYTVTSIQRTRYDQGGAGLDWKLSEQDQLSMRYAIAVANDINPLSIRGADVPGFPVGDDIDTQSATIAETTCSRPR